MINILSVPRAATQSMLMQMNRQSGNRGGGNRQNSNRGRNRNQSPSDSDRDDGNTRMVRDVLGRMLRGSQ